MVKNDRLVWADVTRGLAIFLVLFVHTAVFPAKAGIANPITLTLLSISRLGVPLFVLLSGSLLLVKSESYGVFVKKRISRLVKPWFFWSVIITLDQMIIFHRPVNNLAGLLALFRSIFVPVWFVPMLLGLYLLTPALRILVKNAGQIDVFLICLWWFGGLSILPFLRNTAAFPMVSDNGIVRQVVQFSGYFLGGWWLSKASRKVHKFFWAAGIAGWILTLYKSNADLNFLNYLAPGVVLMAGGGFSGLLTLGPYLSGKINSGIKNVLALISQTTLGIYFVHPLILQTRLIPEGLFGTGLLFLISFGVIYGLQKIAPIRSWVA